MRNFLSTGRISPSVHQVLAVEWQSKAVTTGRWLAQYPLTPSPGDTFMKRELPPLILPFFLLFVFAAGLAQQDTTNTAKRAPRAQKPGSYLIVWTQTQAPEPAPQPSGRQTPSPDPKPETQPPPQPSGSQPESSQAQGPAQAQPAAQSFTGTISKEGDTYVLKVSDTSSYKLDDQDKAKQYEGKRVAVFGVLDTNSNVIRVQKIEPVS